MTFRRLLPLAPLLALFCASPAGANVQFQQGPGYYADAGNTGKPISLATGDFDHDGTDDWVAGTDNGYLITSVEGNRSVAGTLGHYDQVLNMGGSSMAIVNSRDGTGYVYETNGDGTPGTIYGLDGSYFHPGDIAVAADFTGDGAKDLAVIGAGTYPYPPVTVLRNDGGLQFVRDPGYGGTIPTSGYYDKVAAAAPGDFDHDGDLDLAVAVTSGYADRSTDIVYYDLQHGQFGGRPDVRPGERSLASSMVAGDFGKADLAVAAKACADDNALYPDGCLDDWVDFFKDGSRTFSLPGNAFATALAASDLNHDGKTDLLAGQDDGTKGTAKIALQDPSSGLLGNYRAMGPDSFYGFPLAGRPVAVATGDFNGDGMKDFVTADPNQNLVEQWNGKGVAHSLSVSLSDSSITADGTSSTTATATAEDANGAPATGDAVTITANGQDHTATDQGDGTYTATIPSTTTAGSVTVTAKDSTVVPPLTDSTQLTQTPGPVAHVDVTADPTAIPASGASGTTLTATVTDANGNHIPGRTVTLSSTDPDSLDFTTLLSDNGDGTYSRTVTSHDHTAGTYTLTATDQGTNIAGHTDVTVIPGAVDHVTLGLSPSSITANGTSTAAATVTAVDAYGNALDGEPVTITGHPGIGVVTDHHDGTYTATITSTTSAGTSTITAADGSATDARTLTQVAGPPASVSLVLSPGSIAADGTSTATATATVADANGNPISGRNVTFGSTDAGQAITSPVDHHDGTYTATITSSTTAQTTTITATDVLSGKKDAKPLTQTAGAVRTVAVSLTKASVTADGTSQSIATATVKDTYGNPLQGQSVTITGHPGIGSVTDNHNGTYTATITASTTAGHLRHHGRRRQPEGRRPRR